jgi:prepilin-type N-terminal cleavage/methylation domain-containing protein
MKKSGFTIIEIVMVIVIVAILAVISIPRFQNYYYIKLQAAVKKVVSDIRYAQQLALAEHTNYEVVFNTGSATYSVQRSSDSSYATDPYTRANLTTNFSSDAKYGGISISSTSLTSGTLQFDWQGVPQDSLGTPITSEATIGLSYRGNSFTIYITPNTGRVRVQ